MPQVVLTRNHPAVGAWMADAAVVVTVVAVTRLVASSATGQTRLLLLNVILVGVPAAGTWLVLRRRRRMQGRARSHLLWLAIALASWGAGEAYWLFSEVVLQQANPFPSWADVGFLGLVPALLAALILAPSDRTHEISRLRLSVDALGVASALLLLLWGRVLVGVLDDLEQDGVVAASIGLAYPSGDVLVLGLLVILLLGATTVWRPALLRYSLGAGLLLLADAGFVALVAEGTYATGSWFDSGWLAGLALIALGARRVPVGLAEPQGLVAGRSRVAELAVLCAFLGAGVLAVLEIYDGHLKDHPVLAGFMSLVFLSVVLRQGIARVEGEAYAGQLARTQESLIHLGRERRIALDAAGMSTLSWSASGQRWLLGGDARALFGLKGSGNQASQAELMRAVDAQGRVSLRTLRRAVSPAAPAYDLELALQGDAARHVRLRGLSDWSEQGELVGLSGVVFDVTDSWRARQAEARRTTYSTALADLAARLAHHDRLDEAVDDAVMTIGRVVEAASVDAWVQGERLASWRGPAAVETEAEGPLREVDVAVRGDAWGRLGIRCRAGQVADDDWMAFVVAVGGHVGTCVERTRAQHALWHGAHYDPLTGLANRTLLSEHLKAALASTTGLLAVAYLDIDDFKQVNDRFGHPVGDQLLQAVAGRLSASLRPGDFAARLGGDEFAIVLKDLPDVLTAMEAIARVQHAVAQLLFVESTVFEPRTSIGVATTAESRPDPVDLLRNADLAMYVAKRSRQHGAVLFEQPFLDEAVTEGELADELRGAVGRDEVVLLYQPVVLLAAGRVVGAEALVRWMRPGHGLQPPSVFLSVAQRIGLMPEITRFVLREACRWAAVHLEGRDSDAFVVAVNVTGADVIDPLFPDLVRAALTEAGLDPGHLCLEILESSALSDVPAAAARLTELRRDGVHLALDDFGMGSSTVSQLKTLPVDTVKIDKAFVNGLGTELDDSALVSSVISMAHALGLDVIAEGVETERQHEVLLALGCEMGQGYLFGRPAAGPAPEVVRAGRSSGVRPLGAPNIPFPRPRTVVIADDLPDERRILVRFLTRSGLFTVVGEAANGAEAARLVHDLQPDLALLDVSMPVLDGFGCLALIRRESPDTDVVMLSGYASEAAVHTALEGGALGCLEKGTANPSRALAALLGDRDPS